MIIQSFQLYEIIAFTFIVAITSQSSSFTNSVVVDTKLNHGFDQRVTTPRIDLSDFDAPWAAMHQGFHSSKLHCYYATKYVIYSLFEVDIGKVVGTRVFNQKFSTEVASSYLCR